MIKINEANLIADLSAQKWTRAGLANKYDCSTRQIGEYFQKIRRTHEISKERLSDNTILFWISSEGAFTNAGEVVVGLIDELLKKKQAEDIKLAKEEAVVRYNKALMTKLLQERSQTELVVDACLAAMQPLDFKQANPIRYRSADEYDMEVMTALLGDIHWGKLTPDYNVEVAKKRLEYWASKIVSIAKIHRNAYKLDKLVIVCLGDMADNDMLYPGQTFKVDMPVVAQVFTLMEAMAEQIIRLTGAFPKIEVVCVPGNHGRIDKFAHKRTNWDIVLYLGLEKLLRSYKNVSFVMPKNDTDNWLIHEINGHNFLFTHGDMIKMWMNIPFYGLIQRAMRWATSMETDWEYMCTGHFHTANAGFDWNNMEMIMNGCFSSKDDFALEQLGMLSSTKQVVFGVNAKHGITWRYKIKLADVSSDGKKEQ